MADPSAAHLVVVAHGLHGTPESCSGIRAALLEAHPSGSVDVLLSSCSATTLATLFATTDGVDAGGLRLAHEIRDALRARPAVTRLSLIGVSLGGLYLRAALPHLLDLPVEFANFITFATPHVGVRGHLGGLIETAVRWGAVGASGHHLLLADPPLPREGCGAEPLPLLAWMAHPTSPHVLALRRFTRRVLIANVECDDKVPHWSAALVHGGAGALDALAAESALRREPLPPGAAELYPHVTALFQQRPEPAPTATTPAPCSVAEGLQHPPEGALSLGNAGRWYSIGFTALVPFLTEARSLEAALIAQLRAGVGGWVNAEILFREPGAFLLNHVRIAHCRPWLTSVGVDVPRFVARHLFDAPEEARRLQKPLATAAVR